MATTSSDSSVLSLKNIESAPSFTQWQTSLVLTGREVDDIVSGEKKQETRIGFAATNTVNSLKEFFHKGNHSISMLVKNEHKPSDSGKIRKLEFTLTSSSSAGQDVKYGTLSLNNSTNFDDWLKATLTVTRTGATTYDATITVHSLGTDGAAAPTLLHTHTQTGLSNTSLAAASTVYTGFSVNSDKTANTRVYLDDYSLELSATPPPVPAAQAASNIGANTFTANWQAGAGGYSAGYVLEVTTLANNFAAGTFIAADGTTGRPSGIAINDSAAVTQVVSGLNPLTAYVYRLKAANGAGTSAPSTTVKVSTLSDVANIPPTLDAIPDYPAITPTTTQRTIVLTGISSGIGDSQSVTVSATSSNTAIIGHPTIVYNDPDSTALLRFTPKGPEGTVTITVTVNDGQLLDHSTTRTFLVSVRTPPTDVNFTTAADLTEYTNTIAAGTFSHTTNGGVGVAGGGGAVFQPTGSGQNNGVLSMRSQAYPGPNPTLLRQSLFVNFRDMNDTTTTKERGEVRLGFVDALGNVPSEVHKFFESGRNAVLFRFSGEHDPSDNSKLHLLKARVSNYNGSNKTDGAELSISNADIFDHWFKVTFEAVAVGTVQFALSYKVEDYGADGTVYQGVVLESTSPMVVVNGDLLAAPWIYAGYAATTEKTGSKPLYVDNHRVEVLNLPPDAPTALPATLVTPSSFQAKWDASSGAYATSFIVEVSKASDNFAANTFINASGVGGQSTGISVNFPDLRSLKITGLQANTAYRYRIKSINVAGISPASSVVDLTTLLAGQNSQPSLDVIANPGVFTINASQLAIPLTGISAGGETNQIVSISASTTNSALVTNLFIDYFDPETTGTLYFKPGFGQAGTADITVTVNDGQASNHTLSRTFTVNVVNPPALVNFDSAGDLASYLILTSQASLTQSTGSGASASGSFLYERPATNAEHVAIALRNVAYDARSASSLRTSLMLNFSQIPLTTSTKDKAELFLGFIGSTVPASNYKDTFKEEHPSIGVKVKLEHSTTEGKDRRFEIEIFGYDGIDDESKGKQSSDGFASAANWLNVVFTAVRAGFDQYLMSYELYDCGPDGSAPPTLVFNSGPHLFTNTAFFNDRSIFAGFQNNGEKAGATSVWFDNHEVEVNTTASDAPFNQPASNITSNSFMANWAPSALGRAPTSFVLEVSRTVDAFAQGKLITATGVSGQNNGIMINNAAATGLTVSGLLPSQAYSYRVRGVIDGEQSDTQLPASTATLALTDPGSIPDAVNIIAGDLLLGVRATGGVGAEQNYLVNIGPSSDYKNATEVSTVDIGNIAADLALLYGPDWSTRTDLVWSISGTSGSAGANDDPQRTLYISTPELTPGTLAALRTRASEVDQAVPSNALTALANSYQQKAGVPNSHTANSEYAIIQNVTDLNSYASFQTETSSFDYFTPIAEATGAIPGTVLDLHRLAFGVDAEIGSNGALVGRFVLNKDGVLTFVPTSQIGLATVAFKQSATSVSEPLLQTATHIATMVRSGDPAALFSVVFSTQGGSAQAGLDYTSASSVNFPFPLNQTEVNVANTIPNRPGYQGTRWFTVNLSNPSVGVTLGSPSTTTVSIHDAEANPAGTVAFSQATFNAPAVAADNTPATVNFTLTRGVGTTSGEVTVSVSATNGSLVNGTDYDAFAEATSVTFEDGESTATASIQLHLLPMAKLPGTITLTLNGVLSGGASLGTQTTSTATVTGAAGTLSFASADYYVNEEDGVINIPVIRRNGARGIVSTSLTTVAGSASSPADFTTQLGVPVDFADTESLQTIAITIKKNDGDEMHETFSVLLAGTSGGASLGSITTATVHILEPDSKLPTLTILTPAANAKVTDAALASLALTGKATDNKGVTAVRASLNGAPLPNATLDAADAASTNFALAITPVPGLNTLTVQSVDARGNVSAMQTRKFTYVKMRPLKVLITGPANSGTLPAPFPGTQDRQLGSTYSLKATAKTGYVFNGWTGISGPAAELPTLSFVFTEGMELTASFIENPFLAVAGAYNGLVKADTGTLANKSTTGFINATVQTTGGFSGNLSMDGYTLKIIGVFDNSGVARFGTNRDTTVTLARAGKPGLVLSLLLDLNNGTGKLTGQVIEKFRTDTVAVSNVDADRAFFDGKTPATTVAAPYLKNKGAHTAIFAAHATQTGLATADYPQGDGFAIVTVSAKGQVTVVGTLADNTALSASAPLSKDYEVPVFAQLYGKAGLIAGKVKFDSTQTSSDLLGADILWFRPYLWGQHYPFGWMEGIKVDVLGANYGPPATANTSVFPGLSAVNLESGNTSLTFSSGLLAANVVKNINIDTANKVSNAPATDKTFTFKLDAKTGKVSGTFTHSDGTKPAWQGVILQKGANAGGYGFFLSSKPKVITGLGESGAVQISAK